MQKNTAHEWIQQGHVHRRNNEMGKALECYNNALSIDPACEAQQYRQMLMQILEFGNKQIYNV